MPGAVKNVVIVIKGIKCCWNGSDKIVKKKQQPPYAGFHTTPRRQCVSKITIRTPQGSPQNLLTRTRPGSCKDEDKNDRFARTCAIEMHMRMSEERFYAIIFSGNAADQGGDKSFVQASTVGMHMDMSHDQFYPKILRTQNKKKLCASLRTRIARTI